MHRSTSTTRRACALGTTIALIGMSTGFGVLTSTAAYADTSTAAVASSTASQPTDTTAQPTDTTSDQSAGSTASPAPTSPTSTTPADGSTNPSTPAGTDTAAAEPTGTSDAPAASTAPAPSGDTAATADSSAAAAPAEQDAEILGDPAVGERLNVRTAFTAEGWSWTDDQGTVLSTGPFLEVGTEAIGHRISVVVTGADGEIARGTTDAAVAPVFTDADGNQYVDGDSTSIQAVAGEAFSGTFTAEGTPAATYTAQSVSPEDGEYSSVLPEGITFDAATGTVRGTLTSTDESYEVLVTATVGQASSSLFVDISVEAAAPAGILVTAIDAGTLDSAGPTNAWLIAPDGSVSSGDITDFPEDFTPGGRPTVAQGGSLVVYGTSVDRFGNDVLPFDDETGEINWPKTTVTSDVASDLIEELSEGDGPAVAQVTFPHASTHTLTVASAGLPSTSFAVEVTPTAVPTVLTPATPVAAAAPVTPKRPTGRLAYTGTDETAPIAWALGLIAAGAGLVGARALRRRRAQR